MKTSNGTLRRVASNAGISIGSTPTIDQLRKFYDDAQTEALDLAIGAAANWVSDRYWARFVKEIEALKAGQKK